MVCAAARRRAARIALDPLGPHAAARRRASGDRVARAGFAFDSRNCILARLHARAVLHRGALSIGKSKAGGPLFVPFRAGRVAVLCAVSVLALGTAAGGLFRTGRSVVRHDLPPIQSMDAWQLRHPHQRFSQRARCRRFRRRVRFAACDAEGKREMGDSATVSDRGSDCSCDRVRPVSLCRGCYGGISSRWQRGVWNRVFRFTRDTRLLEFRKARHIART